jgi:hypothetical protein
MASSSFFRDHRDAPLSTGHCDAKTLHAGENSKRIDERRLRDEGLKPMELAPSLEQRVKKLRQLEARTRAESAKRKGGSQQLAKEHGSARRLH